MPGPEQRKMLKEAKRQRQLEHLRKVYKKKEEQKSRISTLEKSLSVSKDNTSTSAGFHIPSSTVSNTDHATKATSEDKTPIYKYNSSTASRKRKAEDIEDAFEPEGQGHETKKAKPASGYVPSTGKPYRGTARERPSPPALGTVGALGSKSANVQSKRREAVAKQDTKNLNRNAPKAKVLDGKGPSQPSQGHLQHNKRDAPRAAELGTTEPVKPKPLQGFKRKSGHDLENETRKRTKIDPSATPPNTVPQARTSSFFVQIQKPGHTAAIPTNVKHVQEVVRKPTPKLPKTPRKVAEPPSVVGAEAEALGKKRQREDDTGSVKSKRAKLSASGPAGWKAPSIEGLGELPKGFKNHGNACFANASVQCLLGVPELRAHYEASGKRLSNEVQNMFEGYINLKRPSEKKLLEKRKQLRSAVEGQYFIGAHFSELARDYRDSTGDSISPRTFLHACGALFRDEKDRPLNGDTQQDAGHFTNELLTRLHNEETIGRTEKSLVQELFHVQGGTKLECSCGETRYPPSQPTADSYGMDVILPTEETSTLGELLKDTRVSELLDAHPCPKCKRADTTTLDEFVERLPKYLIVRAPRVRHPEGQDSHHVRGGGRQSGIHKIHTSVEFPAETLDLSFLLKENERKKACQYEVFGTIEHVGASHSSGHYNAFRKIQGNWYRIWDEKVEQVLDEKWLTQGQMFFLRRVK